MKALFSPYGKFSDNHLSSGITDPFLVFYSFFIAVFFIWKFGYSFNWGEHIEHLPQIYKLQDPGLFNKDYYITGIKSTFSIRFYFVYFFYLLSFILPLPALFFFFTLLCIGATALAWSKITALYTSNSLAILIAPLLILIRFIHYTIGENYIQYNQLICSSLGKALVSMAIWQFLAKKYRISALLLGIATLFHMLAGLQVFIILFFVLVLIRNKKALIEVTIPFVVVASFILVPVALDQFRHSQVDPQLYKTVYFYLRFPHHYLISKIPLLPLKNFLLLLITGGVCFWVVPAPDKRTIAYIILVILMGMLCYWLGFEVLELSVIGKFQWMKTSIWLNAFSCIFISILAGKILVYVLDAVILYRFLLPGLVILTIAFLIDILFSRAYTQTDKYKIGYYKKSDLTLVHEWIKVNTPKDALFVVPPDDNSFSCEAQRSQVIGYKAIVHSPEFMKEWYEKMNEIYGYLPLKVESVPVTKYLKQLYHSGYNLTAYKKYGIKYRLDDMSGNSLNQGNILYHKGNYTVSEIK